LDKLDHFKRGIMNTFSISNIEIQIWHSQNTYMILDIYLTPWNVSWILHILSRKENLRIPCKFSYPSETIRNNAINAESTTGSSKFYGFVTQHEMDRCRPNYGTCLPIHSLPVTPQLSHRSNHHLASKIRQHTIKQQYQQSIQRTNLLILLINLTQIIHPYPQFANRIQRRLL
jgi:hypothetical protein